MQKYVLVSFYATLNKMDYTLVGDTGLPGAKRSTGGESGALPPNKTSSSSNNILDLLRGFVVCKQTKTLTGSQPADHVTLLSSPAHG